LSRDLNHHRNRHARPEFPTPTACQPPQTPSSDRWTPDFAGALTIGPSSSARWLAGSWSGRCWRSRAGRPPRCGWPWSAPTTSFGRRPCAIREPIPRDRGGLDGGGTDARRQIILMRIGNRRPKAIQWRSLFLQWAGFLLGDGRLRPCRTIMKCEVTRWDNPTHAHTASMCTRQCRHGGSSSLPGRRRHQDSEKSTGGSRGRGPPVTPTRTFADIVTSKGSACSS